MSRQFAYIVPFYFGERMVTQRVQSYTECLSKNKFYFAEKQIEFLNSCQNKDLKKVIFLVNQRLEDDVDEIGSFFRENTKEISKKFNFSLIFRENKNVSYGAWNDAICSDIILNDEEIYYYFCLEDDYIPSKDDFVYPFIERCNEKTAYVCCKAVYDEHPHVSEYASVSNGLFLKSACKKVYEENKIVFSLTNKNQYTYSDACDNQVLFYRLFLQMGYRITDIADSYYVPFFESDNGMIKKIGAVDKETLIEPILL